MADSCYNVLVKDIYAGTLANNASATSEVKKWICGQARKLGHRRENRPSETNSSKSQQDIGIAYWHIINKKKEKVTALFRRSMLMNMMVI